MPGYGPFQEGTEPTAPIPPQPHPAAQSPSAPDGQPPRGVPGKGGVGPWPTSESPGSSGSEPYPFGGSAPPGGGPTSGGPSGGGPSGGGPSGGGPSGGGPSGGGPTGGGLTGGGPTGGGLTGGGLTGGGPVSGGPVGGGAWPVSGSPDPSSGAPGPTSGTPYPSNPSSPPYPANPASPAYGPFQGDPYPAESNPYGFSSPPGRRIEPTPPPNRGRFFVGLLAGLIVGLLLFGAGGFFAGRATAPEPAAESPNSAGEGGNSQLGVFEQSQAALNAPDFAGTGLVTLSEGWLPFLSTCGRSGTPGGPRLSPGEKVRVRCTLDGMSAIFVEYESVAERDKARVKAMGQAVDARALTPGVGPATEGPTPSGRTTGNYVEYAYRLTEDGTTRTVSGIWWDDAAAPVAGFLLAYWKEGVGEKWEPMRDLWSRYA
ncbi:hypothetical protein ACQPZJ_43755 [Actinoplanes sp. CA-054009]